MSALGLSNKLKALSDMGFNLWQVCHEFSQESSKIVPSGAPLTCLVCFQ
jgi:hypothetical protein